MGNNLRIRKLQQDLVDTLNNSDLPFEVMLLVIEKLHIEIKQKADLEVLKEMEELQKEQEVKSDGQTNENINADNNIHS